MTKPKAVQAAKSSSGYVTVACNMPNGIILRVDHMVEEQEMTLNGSRTTSRAEQVGDRVTLYGTAVAFGKRPRHRIAFGYALTPRVPVDFWNDWLKQNADSDLVKNHVVFAYAKDEDVVAAAKDQRGFRSGVQPLDVKSTGDRKDARVPKGVTKGRREDEETADEDEMEEA